MERTRLDTNKAIQAAAVLLRAEGGEMSYFRLIKLMYLADLRSLKETGARITQDLVVAMKHGNVLSRLLNLAKGQDIETDRWAAHIEREGYRIKLLTSPGNSELSSYEIDTLNRVADELSGVDDFTVAELTHDVAWNRATDVGRRLSDNTKVLEVALEDLIDAADRSDDRERIAEYERESAALDRFFAGLGG